MLLFFAVTGLLAALAPFAGAHTSFTTLFIDDANQGDGTCVRQPLNPQTSTNPVEDLASDDMACGRDGLEAVAFTCAAAPGAKLTFEFRENPNGSTPGLSIDQSHKGPCAVYMKQVTPGTFSTTNSTASAAAPTAGGGWFKIWDEGHDAAAGKWCTEKLIANRGLLSVALPPGIPGGSYYLVRPELLALHNAQAGDPQFYVGCAQIFVLPAGEHGSGSGGSGTLAIPAGREAVIPGYVKAGDPSVSFNIYEPRWPYPLPGPPVFFPDAPENTSRTPTPPGKQQTNNNNSNATTVPTTKPASYEGAIPTNCLLRNANWCGVEVPSYTDEAGCWAASDACFAQEAACYAAAPPSGEAGCDAWDADKCTPLQAACAAGRFVGPPRSPIGHPGGLAEVYAPVPGPIPPAPPPPPPPPSGA